MDKNHLQLSDARKSKSHYSTVKPNNTSTVIGNKNSSIKTIPMN